MRTLLKSQSLGNVSRDSGVQGMVGGKPGTHSRCASDASAAYTVSDEPDPPIGFKLTHLIYLLAGLLISLAAFVGLLYFPTLLRGIIQTYINVKPGGEFYDFWKQSSDPTEVGIFFFHVENPWAVENGLEKLRVREMGKYMFKQRFIREISNFSDDFAMVNFTEKRYFYFDADKTTGSLDDNITVVNVPYAALSTLVSNYVDQSAFSFGIFSHFSYRSINLFLEKHNQHLFINTTIRELLYGYKLDILDTAESYSSTFSKFGLDIMPDNKLFPNNSFGILNGRNGTPDGPYEMYTGLAGTHDLFGNFKAWKGINKLTMWKGDTCNMINGTDGTIWPAGPFNKKDRLYFFIADICRSLYVTFQEESQFKGIPTYIFSAPDDLLAGTRTNPENQCFCLEEDETLAEERCTLDGIFDMSGCQDGIPLIVSLPHFLGADKRITDNIEGLAPNATAHRPELHVEPIMGTVIHGDSRLQMSIRVPKNENLKGFDRLQGDLYLPIFWGYKKLGMSDEVAVELKARLFTPVKIVKIVFYCLITVGAIMFVCGWYFFWSKMTCKREMALNFERESYKETKYTAMEPQTISRTESATSDLGDSNENSCPNTPRSSTINLPVELNSLIGSSHETDI